MTYDYCSFFRVRYYLASDLFTHVIWSLDIKRKRQALLTTGILTLTLVTLGKGFDIKSTLGLFIPALMAFAIAVYKAVHRHPRAKELTLTMAIFLLAMLLSPWLFLDVTFFYITAAFLMVLFFNQAQAYLYERSTRISEQDRANRLQSILEQKREHDKSGSIKITSAGKLEMINIADIAYCKGAGDYTELLLITGRTVLSSDRLVELEKTLPSEFLRVHRSYIVNTSMIESLERKASGVGELLLAREYTVPVSRRIMPTVRGHLA